MIVYPSVTIVNRHVCSEVKCGRNVLAIFNLYIMGKMLRQIISVGICLGLFQSSYKQNTFREMDVLPSSSEGTY
jgi:hypothetical protein